MLNKLSRFILTASSVSPVCGTVAFLVWVKRDQQKWDFWHHLFCWNLNSEEKLFFISILLLFFSIILFPFVLLHSQKEEIWQHPSEIRITSIRSKNSEMTSYLLGYLFPLVSGGDLFINIEISIFFYMFMFFAVWFSDSYGFNPILALFKYKFYEADCENGIGITLITKEQIKNLSTPINLIQFTEYSYIQIKEKI